jgi:hypothetical protein
VKAARVTTAVVLPVVCLLVLTGCLLGGNGAADPDPSPTYDPVPDDQLYAQVARVEGVRSVDLDYMDSFANPNSYGGTIAVERDAKNVAHIVDQACAILWQGHPDASILFEVTLPDRSTVSSTAYHLADPQDLEKRYGPQPGTGEPPRGAPPLTKIPGVP